MPAHEESPGSKQRGYPQKDSDQDDHQNGHLGHTAKALARRGSWHEGHGTCLGGKFSAEQWSGEEERRSMSSEYGIRGRSESILCAWQCEPASLGRFHRYRATPTYRADTCCLYVLK